MTQIGGGTPKIIDSHTACHLGFFSDQNGIGLIFAHYISTNPTKVSSRGPSAGAVLKKKQKKNTHTQLKTDLNPHKKDNNANSIVLDTDRWMDGCTEGRTDKQMKEQTDG